MRGACHAGAGDETRLLANEWGPKVKTVKVYWHVLREGKGYGEGNIPRDAISKQIAVLNQKFASANIRFSVSDLSVSDALPVVFKLIWNTVAHSAVQPSIAASLTAEHCKSSSAAVS